MQADDAHRPTPHARPVPPSRPARIVLGSGSAYRRVQLALLGLPFDVDPADVDESGRPDESPDALAARLAADKARAVAARHPDAVVVGSDQVAVLDGRRLGKPGSPEAAREQLARASGRTVEFVTALHVVDGPGAREHAALERTRATLRTLEADEIRRYVDADSPLDCAGAFKVESLGIALFERVEARDPTALVGLPLIATARLLRECGFAVP